MTRTMRRSPLLGPMFVAAIIGAIICVYWSTFYYLIDLAGTRAESYTHRTFVLPVFFFLLWGRRYELAILPIRSVWWGLLGIFGAGFAWLVGELVFARVLTDFGVIVMVPLAVLTVFGYRWLVALTFPLAFLLFAIPIEGPLVPYLVGWTAKATFMSIQASGVPIYREGAYFVIPTGSWAIAEACSGIAYLTTCLMLGVLYAWTMFGPIVKRIVFVVGAIVIGIVGNWIRTYLTIMVANITDNRLLRDDHGTFGWILFAVFLFGYCWFGSRFRDTRPEEVSVSQSAHAANRVEQQSFNQSPRRHVIFATALVLASLAVWPLFEKGLGRNQQYRVLNFQHIAPQQGWSSVDKRLVEWVPAVKNPSQERIQSFEKAGRQVDVYTGIFQNQTWASKLVTSVNRLADSENSNWSLVDRGRVHAEISGRPLDVKSGVLLGRGDRVLAWHWYWIDGIFTENDTQAKFQQLLARLHGRGDTSAWIAIYTKANASQDAAAKTLEEFARDMGSSLEHALIMTAER